MSHILSNGEYNEIKQLTHLKLLRWIKRTASLYCRGRPPGKYKVKKENIISNLKTAVTYIRVTAVFLRSKIETIYRKTTKPVSK